MDIGLLIKKISNKLEKKANLDLAKYNITMQQSKVLMFLYKSNNEVNQKDIELKFELTNPTVTGILNRLEDKSLIKRISSVKGYKYKSIVLTDYGIEQVKLITNQIVLQEQKLIDNISRNDLEITKDVLVKIFGNIKEDL